MPAPATIGDYRALARRRLPRLLFDYVDGGSYAEMTLAANVADLQRLLLRQRVLRDVGSLSLAVSLFGHPLSMPLLLAPVGMAGMLARRGEVQAARAAARAGVPVCLSTLSVCPIEEVAAVAPPWFQLYMIKDRGYMAALLDRARAAACPVLVFTVDLPVPGTRYRDRRNGMFGGMTLPDRLVQAADFAAHPRWLLDVALAGRPLSFGNVVAAIPRARGPAEFWTWVRDNFDPTLTWAHLDWVRARWPGPIVLKGVLDPEDAQTAAAAGIDGIIVSNHGGRQLDGAPSAIAALPAVAAAVAGRMPVLMDGGIRSGLDLFKALASGASACLIGRAWAYALAARGEAGVAHVLATLREELMTAMALTGRTSIAAIDETALAPGGVG